MAKRILIIDDDASVQTLYQTLFKDAGYDVDSATDGEEGLKKLSEGGWDVTLLDVMMPKLDGVGILTTLQATPPKQKNGPIIVFTSLANDPVVQEALQKGAHSTLIKSDLTPEFVLQKVKSLTA